MIAPSLASLCTLNYDVIAMRVELSLLRNVNSDMPLSLHDLNTRKSTASKSTVSSSVTHACTIHSSAGSRSSWHWVLCVAYGSVVAKFTYATCRHGQANRKTATVVYRPTVEFVVTTRRGWNAGGVWSLGSYFCSLSWIHSNLHRKCRSPLLYLLNRKPGRKPKFSGVFRGGACSCPLLVWENF